MIVIELKKVEEGIIPIYESESKEKLINARELHMALKCNTKFADWIKRRIKHYEFIENKEYICFLKFEKAEKYGNKIPHSNLIGAIARELGYKISYKHYYEDDYIAIVKDLSKSEYWQVYFKQKAVKEIEEWFIHNKEEIYYEIQYIRNTKNGKKGEVKERGYKIENICYEIKNN